MAQRRARRTPMGLTSGIQRGAAAMALLVTSTMGAVAGSPPASAADTPTATADATTTADAAGDFSTSFEAGQPQPELSTVETGPDGARQQNVTGKASTNGSLLGSVVSVSASAENAPGEV